MKQNRTISALFMITAVLVALFATYQLARAVPAARPLLQSGTPQVVSYQGQVTVDGAAYSGAGYFKFAVVNAAGDTTYWANDGTGGGEPATAVPLSVVNGLFNVLLGDTAVPNMTALSAAAFDGPERYLRVWFSSDGATFTQLSPDRRIAAVPYALQAEAAKTASDADTLDSHHASEFAGSSHDHDATYVNEGQVDSITSAMITNGTLAFADIGSNSCTSGQVMQWNGTAWACANVTGTGVSDHGALTGLTDDDHPQYFALGQNEAVTGIPAFTGGTSGSTAPFSVDSMFVVANLNADLLDGYQTGNASGNIPLSNGTVNTNLNADTVDGYHASDLIGSGGWSLTGNTGTAPATNFLGTTDAQPLVLRTNNTEQARLDAAGNLGLGTAAPAERLTVQGNAAVLGYDAPVARGFITAVTLDAPRAVAVAGQYAYVVSEAGDSLSIFDISNPDAIIARGVTVAGLDAPRAVAVAGDYAYVASYATNRMVIFDVSDPDNIVWVGAAYANGPNGVAVSGRYAYVVAYNNTLSIFDVSNPAAPSAVGATTTNLNRPTSVSVSGRYAYVTNYYTPYLSIFDIADPSNIVPRGYTSTSLYAPYAVVVSGRYAYVASWWNGRLVTFDISDLDNPVFLDDINTNLGGVFSVAVAGDYAYVASRNNDALAVFDVSDPANLIAHGFTTTNLDDPQSVVVAGRYAYVASAANDQLAVFDLNRLEAPTADIGSLQTGGLHVGESAIVGNNLTVQDSLNVGGGGALINGDLAVSGSATFRGNNVGIGVTAPGFPLSFADIPGEKISFYGQSGNHTGIGLTTSQLQFYLGNSSGSFGFGYGSNTSFTEAVRIQGNGDVYVQGGLSVQGSAAFNGGTSGSTAPFTVDSTYVVANLNADLLDGQHGSYYWMAGGNSLGAVGRLGTNDNYALELEVNNLRALRLEPNATSPNVIGGYNGNTVTSGVAGAAVGGGGVSGAINSVSANYGTVPGGQGAAATHYGEMAYASGSFSAPGDAQTSIYVLRNTSSGTTFAPLYLDGSATKITLALNRAMTYDILVTGMADNGGAASYQFLGGIQRTSAGIAVIAPPVQTLNMEQDSTWNCSVGADPTNLALDIVCRGAVGRTVHWVATVRTVETTMP